MSPQSKSSTQPSKNGEKLLAAQKKAFNDGFEALVKLQHQQQEFATALFQYTVGLPEETRKFLKLFSDRLLDREEGLPEEINKLAAAWLNFADTQIGILKIGLDFSGALMNWCFDAIQPRGEVDEKSSK